SKFILDQSLEQSTVPLCQSQAACQGAFDLIVLSLHRLSGGTVRRTRKSARLSATANSRARNRSQLSNIDIRNASHQLFSNRLQQYVKGDLLEGDNAYLCEKRDHRRRRRRCLGRAPPRRQPPIAGEGGAPMLKPQRSNRLVGGGGAQRPGPPAAHLLRATSCTAAATAPRSGTNSTDNDVSEYNSSKDDEELSRSASADCTVGRGVRSHDPQDADAQAEPLVECLHSFYERLDFATAPKRWSPSPNPFSDLSLTEPSTTPPAQLHRSMVRRQNLMFMHNKAQFSQEYFSFIKTLIKENAPRPTDQQQQMDGHLGRGDVNLLSETCRPLPVLVGPPGQEDFARARPSDWLEIIAAHLRVSAKVRNYFAKEAFFDHPNRISEYLLSNARPLMFEASLPALIVCTAAPERGGRACPGLGGPQPLPGPDSAPLCRAAAAGRAGVSEHGRHLPQYFYCSTAYLRGGERNAIAGSSSSSSSSSSSAGRVPKRRLLLKPARALLLPAALVTEEGGICPPVKYQYAREFAKLFSVVSIRRPLLRHSAALQTIDQRLSAEAQPLTWTSALAVGRAQRLPADLANMLLQDAAEPHHQKDAGRTQTHLNPDLLIKTQTSHHIAEEPPTPPAQQPQQPQQMQRQTSTPGNTDLHQQAQQQAPAPPPRAAACRSASSKRRSLRRGERPDSPSRLRLTPRAEKVGHSSNNRQYYWSGGRFNSSIVTTTSTSTIYSDAALQSLSQFSSCAHQNCAQVVPRELKCTRCPDRRPDIDIERLSIEIRQLHWNNALIVLAPGSFGARLKQQHFSMIG
uniref:Protein kinase domain-containing protein n=1 Tax=Macrostomum lignano TaxID=282301 RepID=A0A1I8JPT5_9PLAT